MTTTSSSRLNIQDRNLFSSVKLDAVASIHCQKWSNTLKAAEINHPRNRELMEEFQNEFRRFLSASSPVTLDSTFGKSIKEILIKYQKKLKEQNKVNQYELRGALLAVTLLEVIRCVGKQGVENVIEDIMNIYPDIKAHYVASIESFNEVRRRTFHDTEDNYLRFVLASALIAKLGLSKKKTELLHACNLVDGCEKKYSLGKRCSAAASRREKTLEIINGLEKKTRKRLSAASSDSSASGEDTIDSETSSSSPTNKRKKLDSPSANCLAELYELHQLQEQLEISSIASGDSLIISNDDKSCGDDSTVELNTNSNWLDDWIDGELAEFLLSSQEVPEIKFGSVP
jgi:hypothetical protein